MDRYSGILFQKLIENQSSTHVSSVLGSTVQTFYWIENLALTG